jgi:MFS transporter, DHA3 family, macrolide efflux protein
MQLLRDRRIALLVAGQSLNGIGSWCAIVALWGFASFRFDAGPGAIALLGLAWSLPPVLLGPLAGVPIDRLGPKRVLMIADALAAVVSLTFLFAGTFPVLVALATLHGVTSSFSDPALRALPPRLVKDDQLVKANAVLGAAAQSAIVIGPLVAAVAIGAFGIEGAFIIDSLTYVVGVLVLVPFAIGRSSDAPSETSVGAEVREGFQIVRRRPRLALLLGMSGTVYAIWGAFLVIEPVYVRDVLHGSPTMLALLQMTFGIGLLLTTFVVTRMGERVARVRIAAVAAAASGIAAALYVGTAVPAVAFIGIGVWGCVTSFFVVPARTLMQRSAPVETHGRVMALDGTVNSGGHLVALPIVGLAAAAVGVQVAGVAFAAVPIAGGLLTLWRVRRDDPYVEADPHRAVDAVSSASAEPAAVQPAAA